jgi:vacuolar-type H+-ATPase subunit H
MDNLLFTLTLIALSYYFLYHLPNQKTHPNPLSTKSTQTEPDQTSPDSETIQKLTKEKQALLQDQAQKEHTIIGLNQSYEKLEKKKQSGIEQLKKQITQLQSEIRDLAKRPLKPTHTKNTQTDELTQTLDNLIKDIQSLNNSF